MIKDFNNTKYDITVSNEFEDATTEVPDLFGSVFNIISGDFSLNSDAEDFQMELNKLIALNKGLKQYFQTLPDCNVSTHEGLEKDLVDKIKSQFKVVNPRDFAERYQSMKEIMISAAQEDDPDFKIEDFVKSITALVGVNPDLLVTETTALLETLLTFRFEYQYNVPQLQNADAIIFTVNIKPKSGSNGTINVVNQPIKIPIHGGLKIDFTSGLYYSSIRYGAYILKATADSVHQDIIDENSSKHTIGINALMHISSRLGRVNPSLVLGLGKGTELNYSILIGGGVSFGVESKFALSTGLNFTSIKQLSGQYTDNAGHRLQVPISTTKINTYNIIKRAFS